MYVQAKNQSSVMVKIYKIDKKKTLNLSSVMVRVLRHNAKKLSTVMAKIYNCCKNCCNLSSVISKDNGTILNNFA